MTTPDPTQANLPIPPAVGPVPSSGLLTQAEAWAQKVNAEATLGWGWFRGLIAGHPLKAWWLGIVAGAAFGAVFLGFFLWKVWLG